MQTYYMIDGKITSLEGFGDAPHKDYKAIVKRKANHWLAFYSQPVSEAQRAVNECKRIVIGAIV